MRDIHISIRYYIYIYVNKNDKIKQHPYFARRKLVKIKSVDIIKASRYNRDLTCLIRCVVRHACIYVCTISFIDATYQKVVDNGTLFSLTGIHEHKLKLFPLKCQVAEIYI